MSKSYPRATHEGPLALGDIIISCAVLEDGTRLLTQEGFLKAIGRAGKAKGGQGASVDGLPAFLAASNLKPFISEELAESTKPIRFRNSSGVLSYGYKADLLPKVCSVYLEARDSNSLKTSQQHIAVTADILIRALAHVGIVSLIDEATGYQATRERNELEKLLAVYLSEERLKWAKTFPDEFYKQIYRLKGWKYPTVSSHRTPLIGKITNEIVYEKLPPGVLDKLKERNPVVQETKRRRWENFQFLSEDIGQPDLRDHLLQIIALMRASTNWAIFKRLFVRAFPGTEAHQVDLPGVYNDDDLIDVDAS